MRRIITFLSAVVLAALPQLVTALSLPYIDTTTEPDGVVALPDTVDELTRSLFGKYTKVIADNGHPIHILADGDVADNIVFHAAEVLRQHLTEVEDTTFGADKTAVSNALANNEAVLALFQTQDQVEDNDDFNDFLDQTNTQDLKEDEIHLEGTDRYMAQEEPGRNAAYEEILHMTQDYGITPGNPDMQEAINEALENALDEEIYNPLEDLDEESYDQEYLAIGMEAFYGFWAHDPSGDGKAGGEEYDFITRGAVESGDETLYDILTNFFPTRVAYNALVDEDFSGTFSLQYDSENIYTNRSQYLQDVTFQGENDSNLTGNSAANSLTGNAGDNTITGSEGNDAIFGAGGSDTAVFSGPQASYTVTDTGCRVTVADSQSGRDGTDTLSGIEFLEFSDGTVANDQDNDQPVLARIYNQNTPVGDALDLTLSATDQDGDSITYSATSSNSNVEVDVDGTTLTLTPGASFEGNSTITVTASDGSCDDTQTFTFYAIGELEVAPKVIDDTLLSNQLIRIRYEDDTTDEIRPFPGSKKFRYALSVDDTRLVVTNGKLVKVYVNGEKVRQKKIANKPPKKKKHLRLSVSSLYNNYDSVIVTSTKNNKLRLASLRLNDSDQLKKMKKRTETVTNTQPVRLTVKAGNKRIIVKTGSGDAQERNMWKLTRRGNLKKL